MQQPICAVLLTLAALTAQAQGKPQPGKPASTSQLPVIVPVPVPESSLKAGLWSQTITREIPGTPYLRTVSFSDCYGPGTNRTTSAVLPKSTEDGQSCQYREPRLEGEVLRWEVDCNGKGGSVQGPASITFSGGAYRGTATLQRKAGGKVMKMTEAYEGKWVEACQ